MTCGEQTEMDACNGPVIFTLHITWLPAQWCHSLITYTFLQWGQRAKVRSVNSVHYGERKREKPINSISKVIFNESPGAGEDGKQVLIEQTCSGFIIINWKYIHNSFFFFFFQGFPIPLLTRKVFLQCPQMTLTPTGCCSGLRGPGCTGPRLMILLLYKEKTKCKKFLILKIPTLSLLHTPHSLPTFLYFPIHLRYSALTIGL